VSLAVLALIPQRVKAQQACTLCARPAAAAAAAVVPGKQTVFLQQHVQPHTALHMRVLCTSVF
jgi:hypothetical protein